MRIQLNVGPIYHYMQVTLRNVTSPTKVNITAFHAVMFSAAKQHNWKIPGTVEQADMLKYLGYDRVYLGK
jgi:hypothetical protein